MTYFHSNVTISWKVAWKRESNFTCHDWRVRTIFRFQAASVYANVHILTIRRLSETLCSWVSNPWYLGIVLHNIINTQRHIFLCETVPLWKQNVKPAGVNFACVPLRFLHKHPTIINLVASSLTCGTHSKLPNTLRKADWALHSQPIVSNTVENCQIRKLTKIYSQILWK